MGTPRKQRRKFERPTHPWRMDRITEEKELCTRFGLKNRKEIWKAKSRLARIREQARKLLAREGPDADKQTKELVAKINTWGMKAGNLDDILALNIDMLLERRLQTVLFRKGLAATPMQARQLIAHNHVYVKNHRVNVPGYIVLADEEITVRVADDIKVEKRAGKEEEATA